MPKRAGTWLASNGCLSIKGTEAGEILQEPGIKSLIEQRDICSIGENRRKPDLVTLNKGIPRGSYCAMDLVISCREGDHALSLQAQEVGEEQQLDSCLPLSAL